MRELFEYRGYKIGILMIESGKGRWSNSTRFEESGDLPSLPSTTFAFQQSEDAGKQAVLERAKAKIDHVLDATDGCNETGN